MESCLWIRWLRPIALALMELVTWKALMAIFQNRMSSFSRNGESNKQCHNKSLTCVWDLHVGNTLQIMIDKNVKHAKQWRAPQKLNPSPRHHFKQVDHTPNCKGFSIRRQLGRILVRELFVVLPSEELLRCQDVTLRIYGQFSIRWKLARHGYTGKHVVSSYSRLHEYFECRPDAKHHENEGTQNAIGPMGGHDRKQSQVSGKVENFWACQYKMVVLCMALFCVPSSKFILDPDRIRQYLHGRQESIVDEMHKLYCFIIIYTCIYILYIIASIVYNAHHCKFHSVHKNPLSPFVCLRWQKYIHTHMPSLLFMLKQSPCASFNSRCPAWWELPREAATEENKIKFWSLSSKVWPGQLAQLATTVRWTPRGEHVS